MNNESGHDFEPDDPPGSSMAVWMMAGFWALMLGFGFLGVQHYLKQQRAADPPRILATESGAGPAIVLNGSSRGHYRVQGYINGHSVDFLVDTGATAVSIPEGLAKKIGLVRGAAGMAHTANGLATVYSTEIDTLSIGPLQRNKVRALISPGLGEGETLLGMSFLRHFNLVQRENQLQIQTP